MTGLSYSYLSELENNKVFNPSLETMNKIAHALNVKIDDLFYSDLDIDNLKEERKKICKEVNYSQDGKNTQRVVDFIIDKGEL